MKQLTMEDILNSFNMDISTPLQQWEQQIFLLSKFHNISIDKIKSMPMHEVTPLLNELTEYLEKIEKEKKIFPSPSKNKLEDDTRFDLLDIRKKNE